MWLSVLPSHTRIVTYHPAPLLVQVNARAGSGKLQELSIPEMQCWLRSRKLPVGGKKGDLEARILNALGLPPWPAPAAGATEAVAANT
jgi:hypothetical protein